MGSRERASQSLEVVQFILAIHSLVSSIMKCAILFKYAFRRSSPSAASKGGSSKQFFYLSVTAATHFLHFIFFFIPRDVLKGKSEKTKIAWPKNAEPEKLIEPACISARQRNGPNVTDVPLSRSFLFSEST